MKYQIDKQDRYAIFSLEEANLNSMIAPDLKSEFVFLKNEGVRNLILDLKDVQYIDSSGLSSILTGNRLWSDDGSFVMTNINSDGVRKLIEISKLDTILTIIPTLDESIEYVFMEDIERDLNAEGEEE
ncbi:MAG: STAS domain-containing protein [Saprospiraceae bacterium]|nr:STAS domain-containing protein [Saprospiraceae bacterium]